MQHAKRSEPQSCGAGRRGALAPRASVALGTGMPAGAATGAWAGAVSGMMATVLGAEAGAATRGGSGGGRVAGSRQMVLEPDFPPDAFLLVWRS
jgi:hypothetical protein